MHAALRELWVALLFVLGDSSGTRVMSDTVVEAGGRGQRGAESESASESVTGPGPALAYYANRLPNSVNC